MFAQIMEWADGNPGAAIFLMGLLDDEHLFQALPIALKIEECKTIRVTNLYVLFSDLCNKDYELCAHLCRTCPNDVLEDACSRQDYSGRELVHPYLLKFKL